MGLLPQTLREGIERNLPLPLYNKGKSRWLRIAQMENPVVNYSGALKGKLWTIFLVDTREAKGVYQ